MPSTPIQIDDITDVAGTEAAGLENRAADRTIVSTVDYATLMCARLDELQCLLAFEMRDLLVEMRDLLILIESKPPPSEP